MARRHYRVTFDYYIEAETIEKGKQCVINIINLYRKMLGFYSFDVKHISERRSEQQNNAMWLYFEKVEAHCLERGLTVSALFKKPTELLITRYILYTWFATLIKFAFGKEGTSKTTKKEFSVAVDKMQDEFGTRLDYHEPFPSIESQMDNYYDQK